MKTSSILLALIAILTLTGMVATDVLLKQQYDKVDWKNPYQAYEKRSLPTAKHWVIEGTPTGEIVVEQNTGQVQALINPEQAKFFSVRQQGDTTFIAFTPDYSGQRGNPRDGADYELGAGLVLRIPDLQSLFVTNGRLTIRKRTAEAITVGLKNTRLRTNQLAVNDAMKLTASQNSFAVLGADRYGLLQTVVEDSSGVQLNDTQAITFTKQVSSKAEMQLRGQALKWLK